MADSPNTMNPIDWNAIQARLEAIIDVLGRDYVAPGFSLDRGSARLALEYCQRRAAGEPEADPMRWWSLRTATANHLIGLSGASRA